MIDMFPTRLILIPVCYRTIFCDQNRESPASHGEQP